MFHGTPGDEDVEALSIVLLVADRANATAAMSFTLSVTPVNDAPSFQKGSDIEVSEDAGPQTIQNWATAILAGPSDELSQTLVFLVNNNNPSLFERPPVITPDGTLAFTSATDAFGTANVTVRLQDGGGTEGGGRDTSGAITFRIEVLPRNDAPTAIALLNSTVKENKPSAIVGRLSVADPDPEDTHSLSTTDDRFEIVDGQLQLRQGQSLRYDKDSPTIIVQMTATDAGGLSYLSDIAIVVFAHPLPWQNEDKHADTNADKSISPLDALIIVNYLNEFGPRTLPVPPPTSIVFFYDTNGDGQVSPIDVLIVVNLLNLPQTNTEAESTAWLVTGASSVTPSTNSTSSLATFQRRSSRELSPVEAYFHSVVDRASLVKDEHPLLASTRRAELDDLLDDLAEFQLESKIQTTLLQ